VVNERTNDITAMKDGKMMWSGRITVSADGKSRTVTINGTGADGKKFHGKAVYDKE
jgi:VCBS repeat-containing protein